MSARRSGAGWCVVLCGLLSTVACGDDRPSTGTGHAAAALPRGVVASVGSLHVSGETVARIARAQGLDLVQAREQAIYDALWASAARAGPEANEPAVRAARSNVLAHALHEQLWQDARSEPISAEQMAKWTERRWLDVDRPTGLRTVHAVVRLADDADEATTIRCRQLAESLRGAVASAADLARQQAPPKLEGKARFRFRPQDWSDPAVPKFNEAVRGVEPGGLDVKVETLPVVARDGRVLDYTARPGMAFVTEFTEAAAELQARGDLSPVVRTPFGFHVILLLRRLPARKLDGQLRRQELEPTIWSDRAQTARGKLLKQLRSQIEVELVSNVDALLEQVVIEP